MSKIIPHYLVITFGSTGDIYPYMRIAKTLQASGQKMTFITNAHHASLIRDAGLSFVGIGTEDDYLQVIENPDLWHPDKGLGVLMANYRERLEQIIKAVQSMVDQAPKVAIIHPLAVASAAILKERGDLQSIITAYLAPSNLKTCYDPLHIGPIHVPAWMPMFMRYALWWLIEKTGVDPVATVKINQARKAMGLPKVQTLLEHSKEVADLSVTLFPTWFAPTMPDWPDPMIRDDFPLFDVAATVELSLELTAFLEAGDRPVIFTPGTANMHAADFFAKALAAVEKNGQRAIFLTQEPAQLPSSLPETILWQAYSPLSSLLPRVAAIVHHGGIGTTAEALRAKTPQLITPFAWDQFDNGARIEALGVGKVLPAKRLQVNKLARELDALIQLESVRNACTKAAENFASEHDLSDLCREIDGFISSQLHDIELTHGST